VTVGTSDADIAAASSWQSVAMQLGMIGLGRMGANMVRRLHHDGHDCVVHDVDVATITSLEAELGVKGARSLGDLVAAMTPPRSVWIMVPAAYVGATVDPGDTIIDGGNSWDRHDVDRSEALAPAGISYLDVGTSGGVFGLERGYCLMIGGDAEAVERLTPIFESLAPGIGTGQRTPGRADPESPEEHGWLHCGPSGAGHFVKMVHNGIEYGLMAAYAEGLNVLAKANIGDVDHPADAETAPLDAAHYYRYDLDLAKITEVWRRGSVISSWLLDLTAEAFHADPELSAYAGVVSDSGEGRWTINAAIDEGVPVPVLSAALYQRFSSRGRSDVADQVLSAMRAGFGGHIERKDQTR
jgi:6-phosphogluconate dehydrogenase